VRERSCEFASVDGSLQRTVNGCGEILGSHPGILVGTLGQPTSGHQA
jgi:hypothetical protein